MVCLRSRLAILRQLGFSLIELTVVTVVLGIVASLGATVMRDGLTGYLRGREISSADWQGRLALERITRDLRNIADPGSIISGCATATFDFSDVNAARISYTLSTNTLLRNGSQPLASSVTGLRFYCLTSDVQPTIAPGAAATQAYYVTVSMIVSTSNTSAAYRSTVKPWSF